ncbi:S2-RNase [Pyrus ussuriensis x Pyrus communis]|uniref:S2-RNase n=1 Tax=Pyrus ussuriensis x Pyrus communis TaxID=2448454 RepID=A0A5N5FXX0_9ROSA|nr:S2-RNase [Pyrus ussuriensis x Pyrus communis]
MDLSSLRWRHCDWFQKRLPTYPMEGIKPLVVRIVLRLFKLPRTVNKRQGTTCWVNNAHGVQPFSTEDNFVRRWVAKSHGKLSGGIFAPWVCVLPWDDILDIASIRWSDMVERNMSSLSMKAPIVETKFAHLRVSTNLNNLQYNETTMSKPKGDGVCWPKAFDGQVSE